MNIVRDEIAVQAVREEVKLADLAVINKPPPFTPSQPNMDSSPNINNNNPNTYQSYRKPLKRNNPVGGSAPFPKIPPFAATNRPSGTSDGSNIASSFNSSSTSGAPMNKKSKEDAESQREETPVPSAVTSGCVSIYERDKTRVPSGLGRGVFKKPFDCKMVLKTRSPSKILPNPPPPVIVDTLNKPRDNYSDRKGQNKEESLSDWLNPRPSKNDMIDRPSDGPPNDFRPGGDLVNNSEPSAIPGLSGGNSAMRDHSRESRKNADMQSSRGPNEPRPFAHDSRSGDFKGRDPVRGTRWGNNDDNSNRNEDRRQPSQGWLDGGGAAYARQFEGKPGFAPSRGRGNSGRDQDSQDSRSNPRQDYNRQGSYQRNESGGSGSFNNDYNHRNQGWRQRDYHGDSNNRNWRPNADKWNNDRDRGPQGNSPQWRNSSRNQSAWTASGDRRASENSERSNRHQNERFAQFEQNWNTGRNQRSNNNDFSTPSQSSQDQTFRHNFNASHADSDDGKDIIIGQHMSSLKERDSFQKNDIPTSQLNQQVIPPFNNPLPLGNPPFNAFAPQQMLPPNFSSSGPNFLAGNVGPGISNFNPQVPLNPPVSGTTNASVGQIFPNAGANYNSQMSIPGVPVSAAPAYNWPSNTPTSNFGGDVPTSFKESSAVYNNGNSGALNSNPLNVAAPVSSFYSGYQSSNVSMTSTIATPSVTGQVPAPMAGQVPVSQASNYTSEQLQDYQKQWDDYKVKWEKYQQELAEYNKKMQEVNGTAPAPSVQNPQQQALAAAPSSMPMVASVPRSPIVQQPAAALQQMTSALGGVPPLGTTGQLNLQAATAATVLQPNMAPNLGNSLLLNQPGQASTATANPYQQAAAAQVMMNTIQQPTAAFNYAQFYPNAAANQTAATLQQAAGLMSMTNPTYPGAVNFATAAQIPSFYPASGTTGVAAAASANPLGMINPMAAPAGSGAPM